MLRVNQFRLRKEKAVGLPKDPFPRERSDLQSDSTDKDHSAPLVYWIGPQHAIVDVLEILDGLAYSHRSVTNEDYSQENVCP